MRVEGRGRSRIYNSTVSNLEERMEGFAPVVKVIRDGVEFLIPMDEFMADSEEKETDETPASRNLGGPVGRRELRHSRAPYTESPTA